MAAKALGKGPSWLKRTVPQELAPRDLAVFSAPPGGGVGRWFVRRSIDLALAPGVGHRYMVPVDEIEKFPKRSQRLMYARVACVNALREARAAATHPQYQWIADLCRSLAEQNALEVSPRTLLRWDALYQTPADIVKLIDRRGGNTRGKADPAAWALFRGYYLDARGPSARTCWKRTAEDARAQGLTWCSYKSCVRELDERIPRQDQAKFRRPVEYRSRMAPYIEQHPEGWAPGQCWVGDTTPLDLWCRYRGSIIRPYLIMWMDWRSRRRVGWSLVQTPDSGGIMAAFRRGLLDPRNLGGPSEVWIDNGKDYSAWTFHGTSKAERRGKIDIDEVSGGGLFNLLGIKAHFSIAFNPNGKSRLENWFGVMHRSFDKSFTTYCGDGPDTKPEDLNELLRTKPQAIPSFQHVEERLAEYIAGGNASTDHSIADLNGLSPNQMLEDPLLPRKVLADPGVLDLLLQQWHRPVRVGRNGVSLHVAGANRSFGQFTPELATYKAARAGQRPLVRVAYDPDDMRQVRVYTEDYRCICEAPLNGLGGLHNVGPIAVEALKLQLAEQTRYNRASRQAAKGRYHEYLTDAELLAKKQSEMNEAAAPLTPGLADSGGPTKLVQTPLDGQSSEVARGRLRQVVGSDLDYDPMEGVDLAALSRLGRKNDDDDLDASDDEALDAGGEASLRLAGLGDDEDLSGVRGGMDAVDDDDTHPLDSMP